MPNSTTLLFFALLFFSALCNAIIIPFMAFFLVEGLAEAPWKLSVYSGLSVLFTVLLNRTFGKYIASGAAILPIVIAASVGYLIANVTLFFHPTYLIALTVGVMGFGLSSSAISTVFSLGASIAKHNDVPLTRLNAYMRATTSVAWMIGPALSYLVAYWFDVNFVFLLGTLLALVWLTVLGLSAIRLDIKRDKKVSDEQGKGTNSKHYLWLTMSFIFTLSFAHSLTFSSLPVFFVQEVNLPYFAPGLAFSIKTCIEVIAIFSTPFLIVRYGIEKALVGTAVLAVIAISMLSSVTSFYQMLIGAALEGAYYGLYASLGISFVHQRIKGHSAQINAMYWNTLIVSGLLAGPLVGLIAEYHNFRTVLHVAIAVAVCALVNILYLSCNTQCDNKSRSTQ
ncbi:MFS transporter [Marinomonas agarivorans]|nr:MFS transporter [Marinomonas agarivorans]